MVPWEGTRSITVISACMDWHGRPTFAVNAAEVTHEEAVNGVHFYLVEADLLNAGYDEPFVHFSEDEAPPFLLPAVIEHLGPSPAVNDSPSTTTPEEAACPASSK